MEFALAAGLREGDVLGITRGADAAGGSADGVAALHVALLSRALCCLPPTFAGARWCLLWRAAVCELHGFSTCQVVGV